MQDAERLAQEELLARLKRGDEQALADLADEFGTKIYQLAFRYLRNKEDAEEVTQDVLFKVYRKVGAFRGDAALSSWIYRITFNAAMASKCPRRAPTSLTTATWPTNRCSARSSVVRCCAPFSRCRRSIAPP